jgi:glutathione synthase
MQILFVADPLESFKIGKDSTFTMMREAQRRGHRLLACEPRDIRWVSGGLVVARTRQIELTALQSDGVHRTGEPAADGAGALVQPGSPGTASSKSYSTTSGWFRTLVVHPAFKLREADAIVMRKDPPFDSEYFYATHLLGQAEREGARVFNKPSALRDHPEKLAILEFPQFTPPTLVTRREDDIRAFHAEHRDIILKPLDGMGGMGIFRVGPDGLNLGAICETLNRGGAQTVMVQRFLPEIVHGDKRVLVIAGEPVPYSLARIPQGGEVRGNLAAGGKGVALPLTDGERAIAESLGPPLAARGLLLIGLDVIGDRLTEINVTSPTCFREIMDQTGFDVAARFVDALEAEVAVE